MRPGPRFPRPLPLREAALALAVGLAALLGLHCGGSTHAKIPGPAALTLTVETPVEGAIVAAPSLRLQGTVSEPRAAVAVDRQPVTVRADGRFDLDLTLTEGSNTLTVEAWTEATVATGRGSSLLPPSGLAEARVTRQVTFKRPPLLLTVSAPLDGATFTTPSLQAAGVVSEADATLTINGAPVALSSSGAFSTTLALTSGSNTFTFLAVGQGLAPRSASVSRTVTCTPPPPPPTGSLTLSLAEPTEGLLTRAAQVPVSGQASDPTATLQVNGQPTPLDAQGHFALSLSPAEGPLTILAEATDALGHKAQDTRHIVIDRTPPRITLSQPLPALVGTRSLSVAGTVDDPGALLSLNGQSLPLDAGGRFQATLSLTEGANHLAFQAVDAAGNVSALAGDTRCDTLAPVVTLLAPAEGLITNQHSVAVKGQVDDPTATLLVAGQALKPAADGSFETTLSPGEGSFLLVALATDAAGNTGHASRAIVLDWTPPTLAWAGPTPAEGALLATASFQAQATLSETAATTLNGVVLTLQTPSVGDTSLAPYWVANALTAPDGPVTLVLEATDRAGNTSRLERHFSVGTELPRVILETPLEGAQTTAATTTLVGHVECGDFLKPLTVTLNGSAVPVDADGRFSLPVPLAEGPNTFRAVAVNRFGGSGQASRILNRFTTPFGVRIDWPLDGMATPAVSTTVRGRVLRPGASVAVNGLAATVDPATLLFTAEAPLQRGLNTLAAEARDAVGNTGRDQVRVTSAPPTTPDATYQWEVPLAGSRSQTRAVAIQGQADLPGVSSVSVNGQAMILTGTGASGRFTGSVALEATGPNTLVLTVGTVAGQTFTEQREVLFVPELPRLRLRAPDTARPGDRIPLQVFPEVGTTLVKAELSWNGRALATVTDPFAAVQAQVPADAVPGTQLPVEALGTDAQGATVTARTYVTVYDQGALVIEAFDDRRSLPLGDGTAMATLESSPGQPLDGHGRAALPTALPQNWIKVEKPRFTSVWRSAALTVGAAQTALDARLTALDPGQPADISAFHGAFCGGALQVDLPAPALLGNGSLSATPLSTQGLPALLPLGWSPVAAWWLQADGAGLGAPGTASLTLPQATPALPEDATYAWVRWDDATHTWLVLSAALSASTLSGLPLPAVGGYALVLADPSPTNPPLPMAGSLLPGYEGADWHPGLTATGSVVPALLATMDALRGARATARFSLGFQDGAAAPSGAVITVDVLESYVLLDQSLIEPDVLSQDAVASRWLLEVVDGLPVLTGAPEGLGLRLPVRMSRTFTPSDLVEGRIFVGFYHDGVQVAQSGSDLIGAGGGTVSSGGVNLSLAPGAVGGTTLVRLSADPGDPAALWPELATQGAVAKSFSVDIVGTLLSGLGLSLDTLSLPATARPLLLQRRVVQGERLVLAVGALAPQGSAWVLQTPPGGNAVLEGGSFAVLAPAQPWDWVSGTAWLPASVATPLIAKLGVKARMTTGSSRPSSAPSAPLRESGSPTDASPGDAAVADMVAEGGFLLATSGPEGAFAVPVLVPAGGAAATVRGARRDLGLTGTLAVAVPSTGNSLRLATLPFRITTVIPEELAEVSVGSVVQVLVSTAADPATLDQVRLSLDSAPADAIPVRRSLSQDGRTLLLTPVDPLAAGATYRVATAGLASLSGEVAPAFTRRFTTQATAQDPAVDFSRIQLSYPTEALDVTVTLPEGSVPPWSLVEVVAPAMGALGTGVMPLAGALVFQLKASLGERLTVTVQFRDGHSVAGTIGRYVAPDGRTTLGVDGGRVEGPGGLALLVPKEALDGPVELSVEVLTEAPTPPEGALREGEALRPALRLRASQELTFKTPPVVELPLALLPAGVDTAPGTAWFGNGPLALFRKEITTLPDGSTDEALILLDTAELRTTAAGPRLVSLGGLRLPDPLLGTVVQRQAVKLVAAPAAAPATTAKVALAPGAGTERPFYIGGGLTGALLDIFLLGFPETATPEYRYHSGTVYRNWNGLAPCGGSASATCYGVLPGAEVHRYSGTADLEAARRGRLARGRLLATCDALGRYLSVGGPLAGAIPGQSWIALFAVDPRTGETSIDPNSPSAPDLGLPWTSREHSLAITSQGGDPFDPTLAAPRPRALLLDSTGTARTVFAAGESATLRITTETGSQPVVRGTVSGSLTQTFGALPTEFPVTFTEAGTWHLDILAWTAKPTQGATSLAVVVTPADQLGPSLPGKPVVLSRDPAPGETGVEPSALVKITFSEPVQNATASSFSLTVNGVDVPFKVITNGQEVTDSATRVQSVWLVPDQRLGLGATVAVRLSPFLTDQDGDSLDPVAWSFTIRGADTVGTLAGVGTYSELVLNRGTVYAVEQVGVSAGGSEFDIAGIPIQAIRMLDVSDPSQPTLGNSFGAHGSWVPQGALYANHWANYEPFYKHEVNGLRVAMGVPVNGQSRDLLLVLTRPRQVTELLVWSSDGDNEYRSRHSVVWGYDITGDEASFGENRTPKLLLVSSLGTLSENWGKGLGSAGGVLGVVRLRGGLTLWDAEAWASGLVEDAQATGAFNGLQWLAYMAMRDKGYFPPPPSVVASNGFYDATALADPTLLSSYYFNPSVMSAVITDNANGRPIGYAAMGYSQGYLMAIDAKVGEPMAKATFSAGGPYGLDSRLTDLSPAVNHEPANLVEVLKGSWQGPSGSETGTLLLAATTTGSSGAGSTSQAHLWVLRTERGALNQPAATQYALATVPGRITKIQPDPARLLVGVEVGGQVYVFDLKNLQPSTSGSDTVPMPLTAVYQFQATGGWMIAEGMVYATNPTTKTMVIKNLDAPLITTMSGAPLLVDASKWMLGTNTVFDGGDASVLAQKARSLADSGVAPMPQKLIYAMSDMQGRNNAYPYLRYYYPDLGPMQVSAVMEFLDPTTFGLMTAPNSPWFMRAEAKLLKSGTEIPGAMEIQPFRIIRGEAGQEDQIELLSDPEGRISGDGDRAKLELSFDGKTDLAGNPLDLTRIPKFAYTPYQFQINPAKLAEEGAAIRMDDQERYRVKLKFSLYENREKYSVGQTTQVRTMEFIVKFNSNTTVHDVVRGGVWHYDPQVSATDPRINLDNPAMRQLDAFMKSHLNSTADFDSLPDTLALRLSKTPLLEIPPGTVVDGNAIATTQGTYSLMDMRLDQVQQGLETALCNLRRRVYTAPGQDNTQSGAMPNPVRPTLSAPAQVQTTDGRAITLRGDPYGAYGYRMVQVVNAMQSFTEAEVGLDLSRVVDRPKRWAPDPGNFPSELDPSLSLDQQIAGRILPVLHQPFKVDANTYNPASPLVQHMVAYPKLRSWGHVENGQDNGLYPVNILVTRDLLVGPMGVFLDTNHPLTGESLKAQRQRIDTAIAAINRLPNRSEVGSGGMAGYIDAYNFLMRTLAGQDIILDVGGSYWNTGLGMLQLLLCPNWHRLSAERTVPYHPFQNGHAAFLSANPADWNYTQNPDFFSNIRADISSFLLDPEHLKAGRVDVLVNGIQNKPEELDEAAQSLQRKLDGLRGPLNATGHVPVIATYNISAKMYVGHDWRPFNVLDCADLLQQKDDTANPNRRTSNKDSIRLMATLKALVQSVWSRDYQLAFYKAQVDPAIQREYWDVAGGWDLHSGPAPKVVTRDQLLAFENPWIELMANHALVPKTLDTIEADFPVDHEAEKGAAQVHLEREALIQKALQTSRSTLYAEFLRLYDKLCKIKLTLHAHSQGGLLAAVAHTRLGEVTSTRLTPQGKDADTFAKGRVGVAQQIALVTYGSAANMYDWGPGAFYNSYTHHVNRRDLVPMALGMADPFHVFTGPLVPIVAQASNTLRNPSTLLGATAWGLNSPLLLRATPPADLSRAWKENHTVIFHDSSAFWPNTVEHNMITGYMCNVEPDPATLTPMSWPLNYLTKLSGQPRCQDQGIIP